MGDDSNFADKSSSVTSVPGMFRQQSGESSSSDATTLPLDEDGVSQGNVPGIIDDKSPSDECMEVADACVENVGESMEDRPVSGAESMDEGSVKENDKSTSTVKTEKYINNGTDHHERFDASFEWKPESNAIGSFRAAIVMDPNAHFQMSALHQKCSIFNALEEKYFEKIRFAYVFGPSGEYAITITADNEVFLFGENDNHVFGHFDNIQYRNTPTGFPLDRNSTCLNGMQTMASGHYHSVGKMEDNKLEYWGSNRQGQFNDNPAHEPNRHPGPLSATPSGTEEKSKPKNTVSKVACGRFHSLALLNSSEVIHFRSHYFPTSYTGSRRQCYGERVTEVSQLAAIDIACSATASYILSIGNEVYTWGWRVDESIQEISPRHPAVPVDSYDQVTNSSFEEWNDIKPISGLKHIVKIEAADHYLLALNYVGTAYVYGTVHFQSGGFRRYEPPRKCMQQSASEIKFVDIAAVYSTNISALVDTKGMIYIFGRNAGDPEPITGCYSFHNIFLDYLGSESPRTYKPIIISEDEEGSDFNSAVTSSITIPSTLSTSTELPSTLERRPISPPIPIMIEKRKADEKDDSGPDDFEKKKKFN